RVGDEHVAVARVVERIEDHLEAVFIENAIGIAAHLGGDDAGRLGIVGVYGDENVPRVVQHADLGALGRRLAFVALLLRELDGGGREAAVSRMKSRTTTSGRSAVASGSSIDRATIGLSTRREDRRQQEGP